MMSDATGSIGLAGERERRRDSGRDEVGALSIRRVSVSYSKLIVLGTILVDCCI